MSQEDFPEAPSWFARLLWPLNQFITSMFLALNRGLTFEENFQCNLRTLTFRTATTYTSDRTWVNITYAHNLPRPPFGVLLCKLTETNNPTGSEALNSMGTKLKWSEFGGQVTIRFIEGLNDNTDYTINLLTF